MLKNISDSVLNGDKIDKKTALELLNYDLEELTMWEDKICEYYCGNYFDLCTIINGKSGRCSENCKFCAQSSHYKSDIDTYELLDCESIKKESIYNEKKVYLVIHIDNKRIN